MSAGHTPGPWVVRNYDDDGREKHIMANVGGKSVSVAGYCLPADARLIAAAPDLLEAAADALAGWNYIRAAHGDLYGVGWDRVEQALTAAIAKARGEA